MLNLLNKRENLKAKTHTQRNYLKMAMLILLLTIFTSLMQKLQM
jgi:hypothetical protein